MVRWRRQLCGCTGDSCAQTEHNDVQEEQVHTGCLLPRPWIMWHASSTPKRTCIILFGVAFVMPSPVTASTNSLCSSAVHLNVRFFGCFGGTSAEGYIGRAPVDGWGQVGKGGVN